MSIKETTVKGLFAASGNLCALCLKDGKQTLLVDSDGCLVSEIAHIRAQNKKGPRYDASYKNVDEACNLIPLCCNCHERIDKYPEKYSVEYLEEIKRNHEAKFTTAIRDLATIHDITKIHNAIYPKNLNYLLKEENLTTTEIQETLKNYEIFINELKSLPANCRKFLEVCLERAQGNHLASLTQEIEQCLNLSRKDCYELYSICEKHGFVHCEKGEDDNNYYFYLICPSKIDFNIFLDLRKVAKRKKISLSIFFDNLDFSLLD